MTDYTKVSDEMLEDRRFSFAATLVYAKLCYRMRLSVRNHKFYDHGYFVIYKIDDLAHDLGAGRNAIINAMKQLVHYGFLVKVKKMFCQRLYLPKLNNHNHGSQKPTHESLKSKLCNNNQDSRINKNQDVCVPRPRAPRVERSSSRRPNRHHSSNRQPSFKRLCRVYKPKLVHYAVKLTKKSVKIIYNKFNFVIGILEKWQRKGIKDLKAAIAYETGHYHRKHYGRHGFSSQSPQARQVIEELPDWGRKGYHYDSKKDVASPRIIRESKIIMKKLRREQCESREKQFQRIRGHEIK